MFKLTHMPGGGARRSLGLCDATPGLPDTVSEGAGQTVQRSVILVTIKIEPLLRNFKNV